MSVESSKKTSTRAKAAAIFALIAIFLLAAALRLNNLDWDRGQHVHPDERYMTYLATLLQRPSSLSAYFDSAASPLNPMNTTWGASYVYGTLPLFTARFFAEFLNVVCRSGVDGLSVCAHMPFTSYDGMAIAGRLASTLEDLVTLAATFFIARRLFGTRTGLLAALFGALTVLNIQQAHFFTVDSMATMFVALCAMMCVWATSLRPDKPHHTKKLFALMALAGLFAGCAIASKISVWPLVPLIMLAAGVAVWRWAGWLDDAPAFVTLIAALILAGVMTFLAFRITQPYSFVGNSDTEFYNTVRDCALYGDGNTLMKVCDLAVRLPAPLRAVFAPSSRWIQQLVLAQMFVSGTVDAPFGIQWANRQPIVFPLVNFVFYGAGIGLALAAIAGFAYALRQMWLGHRAWRYIIIVTWVGLYFAYQSTQWTKSIRYLFPIYPLACVLAAHGLMALWQHAISPSLTREKLRTGNNLAARVLRFIAPVAIALALILHGAWAIAFSNIYNQPLARLQATDWVYANVPSAVSLLTSAGETQLPIKTLFASATSADTISIRPADMPASETPLSEIKLRLNRINGEGALRAKLYNLNTDELIGEAVGAVNAKQLTLDFGTAQLNPHGTYYIRLEAAADGTTIAANTSVVTWEHWDDPMPLNTNGRAPGLYYNALTSSPSGQMENYNEDTPQKQANLINWLDEADTIIISSNRLYASIPRLPYRYPLTVEYYRALFAGELGFDLALNSYVFPHLGPFQFNDQEMPIPLDGARSNSLFVPYPTAEEAFSVYDHPRVLVFTKNANYSREKALRILGKVDVYGAVKQAPTEAVNAPNGMLLTPAQKAAQQTGLTWAQLFPATSPLNQSQPLAVLAWLALIEALGLAAFPILALATRGKLAGGGFGFAKTLGLLLVAVAVWLMGSAQILAFSAGAVWLVMALLVIVGLFLWMRRGSYLFALLKENRAAIVVGEIVFLAAFGAWLAVRAGNPDLWHAYMGGEKPMDFAYLNAILRSAYFPPVDPWFSGGYINYYYFGLVIVAAPIKALGIEPAVAYNIAIPMLFALTAAGAFVLGCTLARLAGQTFKRANSLAGILAALFVAGIGNLQEIRVMGGAWATLGGIDGGVNALEATARGFGQWLMGSPLPMYSMTPYWDATRIHPSVPIAEFPLFTFLYADLHAHMIAMPLVLLAFGFAIAFAKSAVNWKSILLGSLVVGALYPTNSWDYPTLLLLCLAGIVIGVLNAKNDNGEAMPRPYVKLVLSIAAFALLTRAWFAPFYANFGQAYNAVDLWAGERTPLDVYAKIYAIFLIPIGLYLLSGAWRTLSALAETRQYRWVIFGVGLGAISMAAGGALTMRGIPVALAALPMAAAAFLAALSPGTAPSRRLMWLTAAGAITLTLAVEIIVLRGDIGRMNTVFKFYVQVWLLLGIIAAPVSIWLMARHRWAAPLVAALVLGGLVYPAFAIPAKMNDRISEAAPRGLNGEIYMQTAQRTEPGHPPAQPENTFALSSDYEAILWLRQNAQGSPTIIEGATNPDLYRWGNRMSIYTGLPSVIGWWWHENQQRASLPYSIVADRERDVSEFYSTNDPDLAKQIALRYDARYVILGDLEKTYYPAKGLLKFEALAHSGFLRVAFRNAGTTVYEVVR